MVGVPHDFLKSVRPNSSLASETLHLVKGPYASRVVRRLFGLVDGFVADRCRGLLTQAVCILGNPL